MKKLVHFGPAILFILFVCSCGTPLQDYQPKSETENEIKSLLVKFAKARNEYDVTKMVSYFTDSCKIDIWDYYLTKPEFILRTKNSGLESYGKIKFTNPDITILDESAVANLSIKQGITSFRMKFKMIRENDEWKISEWTVSR